MYYRQPAVFLDKDGTLIEDVPHNVDPDRIRLAPGVGEGLARLRAVGFRLIVVSNQSGVARGFFTEEALAIVRDRINELLEAFGVELDGFYHCPHHPEGVEPRYAVACDCRKPAPGMILKAARERAVDLDRSWFIGDILDDVEAAHRAGCRAALIDNGNETEWTRSPLRWPEIVATDLAEAARLIAADLDSDPEMESNRPLEPNAQPTGGRP